MFRTGSIFSSLICRVCHFSHLWQVQQSYQNYRSDIFAAKSIALIFSLQHARVTESTDTPINLGTFFLRHSLFYQEVHYSRAWCTKTVLHVTFTINYRSYNLNLHDRTETKHIFVFNLHDSTFPTAYKFSAKSRRRCIERFLSMTSRHINYIWVYGTSVARHLQLSRRLACMMIPLRHRVRTSPDRAVSPPRHARCLVAVAHHLATAPKVHLTGQSAASPTHGRYSRLPRSPAKQPQRLQRW